MKANKIYTSAQENIDTRYQKLNDNYTAKETELQNALAQLTQLQQANQGNVDLQNQLAIKDQEIATLRAQNLEVARDNNIKMALLTNGAKADDIDYLLFKLKDEFKCDDNGKITNADDIMKSAKETYQNNFESTKKVVQVKDLPGGDPNNDIEPGNLAEALEQAYTEK